MTNKMGTSEIGDIQVVDEIYRLLYTWGKVCPKWPKMIQNAYFWSYLKNELDVAYLP